MFNTVFIDDRITKDTVGFFPPVSARSHFLLSPVQDAGRRLISRVRDVSSKLCSPQPWKGKQSEASAAKIKPVRWDQTQMEPAGNMVLSVSKHNPEAAL